MLHSEAQVWPAVQTNGDASAKETFFDAKHGLSGKNLALLRKSGGRGEVGLVKNHQIITHAHLLPTRT